MTKTSMKLVTEYLVLAASFAQPHASHPSMRWSKVISRHLLSPSSEFNSIPSPDCANAAVHDVLRQGELGVGDTF